MRGLYSKGIYGKPTVRQAGAGERRGRGESVSCSGG